MSFLPLLERQVSAWPTAVVGTPLGQVSSGLLAATASTASSIGQLDVIGTTVAGNAVAAASITPSLTVIRSLTAAAGTTATLSASQTVTSTATAAASTSASLLVQQTVFVTITSSTVATANITSNVTVIKLLAATAGTTAAVAVLQTVTSTATANAAATVTIQPTTSSALLSAGSSAASLTAQQTVITGLTSNAGTAASIGAVVTTSNSITAAAATTATTTSTQTVTSPLLAAANTTASFTAAVTVQRALTAAAGTAASATATVTISSTLSASAVATATTIVLLTVQKALIAAAEATATATPPVTDWLGSDAWIATDAWSAHGSAVGSALAVSIATGAAISASVTAPATLSAQTTTTASISALVTVSGALTAVGSASATVTPNSLLQTGFEVAPAGTTIPTTGFNGGDAFTGGTDGAGASFVSDNSIPDAIATGSYCAKITIPATAQVAWRGWSFPARTVSSGSKYIYLTAAPPATMTIVAMFQGGVQRARLLITTSRTLQHHNGTAFSGTSTAAIPLNTLVRVSWKWDITANTFIADLYLGHSATPMAGGLGLAAQAFGITDVDEERGGASAAQVSNYTYYTDAWVSSDSATRPGPAAAFTTWTSTVVATSATSATIGQSQTEPGALTATGIGSATIGGFVAESGTLVATGTSTASVGPQVTVPGVITAAGVSTASITAATLAETVVDTFTTQDTTKWTFGSGTAVTSGELVITPTTAYPRITSVNRYSILGSNFGGRLTQRVSATDGSTMATILRVAIDATNSIELSVSKSGGVGAVIKINGDTSGTNSFYPGLVANATHYRIAVATNRTITWQAMVAGTWFTIRTNVTAPIAWDLSSVQLLVMAGTANGAETSVVPAKWTSIGVYNDVSPSLTNTMVDFGVATGSAPPTTTEINAYQTLIGRKPHIELWYRAWVNTISASDLDQVRARGNVSLLTWEAWDWGPGNTSTTYNLPNITAGNFDAYITQTATTMRDWGGLIYLRPLHEMNHTAYPWDVGVNGNVVSDFIPAWTHIVDIFRAVGATNVRFVWSPNQIAGANTLAPLYPGDSYVDVIALDAYNFGGTTYTWPANVFDGSLAEIRSITTTKPLWIGETSSAPTGGDKAQWVTEFFNWVRASDIQAFCWFDINKENDWRVNSSTAVQNAFTAGVATLTSQFSVLAATGSSSATIAGAQTVTTTLAANAVASATISALRTATSSLTATAATTAAVLTVGTTSSTLTAGAATVASIAPLKTVVGTLTASGTSSAAIAVSGTTSSTITANAVTAASITPLKTAVGGLAANSVTSAAITAGFVTVASILTSSGTATATLLVSGTTSNTLAANAVTAASITPAKTTFSILTVSGVASAIVAGFASHLAGMNATAAATANVAAGVTRFTTLTASGQAGASVVAVIPTISSLVAHANAAANIFLAQVSDALPPLSHPITGLFTNTDVSVGVFTDKTFTGVYTNEHISTATFSRDLTWLCLFKYDGVGTAAYTTDGVSTSNGFKNDGTTVAPVFIFDGVGVASFG